MDSLVLYAIALLLFTYRVMATRKNEELVFLAVFMAAGAALALYESADVFLMLLGILIFNGMASTYRTRDNYAFSALGIIFLLQTFYMISFAAQAMLLGFLSAAYFFTKHTERANAAVEVRRDVVQLVLGFAFIIAFAFFPQAFVDLALISFILGASVVGNFSVRHGERRISKMLDSFERHGAVLGQGAMWLAAGALMAIAFLRSGILVAVLAAIMLGDAAATLVGTRYRRPLPYNKKKSAYGTLAYFAVAALVAYPFVGYACIAIGLVGALVESLPVHIDDNLDTAVALTVFAIALGYLGLVA
ncbi:MAG: hypothetical protein M1286_01835 [Candidatus Marsarchaeota archaeon]|nr:hypothetical protein [Candidatus Marsarchaeota archaeon]